MFAPADRPGGSALMNRHRELAQMMSAPAAPPTGGIPTNGLLNWWKLDEVTGSVANDSGSRNIPGTIYLNTDPSSDRWVYDDILGRQVLDATIDVRVKVDGAGSDNPNDMTFVLHLKLIANNSYQYLMDYLVARRILALGSGNGGYRCYDGAGWNESLDTTWIYSEGWAQCAFKYTYSTGLVVPVYEGVAGSALPFNADQSAFGADAAALFGRSGTGSSAGINGHAADVLFYNRLLSDQELSNIRAEVIGV